MTFALQPGPLHWSEQGQSHRPRIVFLHGFMGASQDWASIMADLSADYHCLALDLPGHGQSLGLAPMDYSMAGTAQLIQDALQQGIKPQLPLADLLVGYSMGGRLALYLGLRFPQSFPQAQIISGSPGLMNQKKRKSRQEEDLNRCREIKSNLKVFLSLWYQQPLFASLWKTSAVEAMLAQRLRNNPDEICLSLEHLGLGSQPSLWEELPNSQANLHQIVGELDSKFVAIAQEMRRWNPNLDLRVIPDVGHNIPLENPASIVAEIRRVMA